MNSIFFTVITLLLLTAGVLLLMQEFNKTKVSKDTSEPPQPELMTKEEGEDHFSVLMNSVTPVWYWRVNHEYIDFLHATIKRMKMSEINDTPGLFEAQRRCSDLNSAGKSRASRASGHTVKFLSAATREAAEPAETAHIGTDSGRIEASESQARKGFCANRCTNTSP